VALAIDASTPAVATSSVAACASPSFTPPDGALLLIRWSGNSAGGGSPSQPTITDNLGSHLTYTPVDWQSHADTPNVNGQSATWWAIVGTSAAMTVTVTNQDAGFPHGAIHVTVLTGHDPVAPIGVHGKAGSSAASSISQSYIGQVSGGWGFIGVCDWDTNGNMTAGSGCTLTDGGTGSVPSQFSYGFIRRSSADDTNGGSNALNVGIAATSHNLNWTYAEVLPYVPPPLDPLPRFLATPPPWLLFELAGNNQRIWSAGERIDGAGPALQYAYVMPWNTTSATKTVRVMTMPGDVLVVVAGTEDSTFTLTTPTGGGLSYGLLQSVVTASFATAYAWSAVDAVGQVFDLSLTASSGSAFWGAVVYRFSNSAGVGATAKANVAGAAPSLGLTTNQPNSAVVAVNNDWSASDGAQRIWRTVNAITPSASNALEKVYVQNEIHFTAYSAFWPAAGAAGAKTLGLTTPSQTYSIIGVEVLGPSAATTTWFATQQRPAQRIQPRLRRRSNSWVPPPQDAPQNVAEPRRRALPRLRIPRSTFIPPGQQPPPAVSQHPRRQQVPRLRLARNPFIPPPQESPPAVRGGRRPLVPRLRTPRSSLVPPPQAAPTPPLWTPSVTRIFRRIVRLPQRHTPQIVPAQVVVTAPTYVPMPARIRLRAARLLKPRNAAPVPGQSQPPSVERTRWARVTLPTRKQRAVVPLQATPPLPGAHRPVVPQVRTVRRTRAVVPAQIVLIAPPYVPARTPRRQLAAWMRRRTNSAGWLVSIQGVGREAPYISQTPLSAANTNARTDRSSTAEFTYTSQTSPATRTDGDQR